MGPNFSKKCDSYLCSIIENLNSQTTSSNRSRTLGWNVHEFDLHYIHEHWLSYLEPDYKVHYTIAVLCTYLIFFTFFGNYSLIKIFCTTKKLRSPSGLLVLNLALADLLSSANTPLLVYSSYHAGYTLPHSYCQLYAAVGVTSGVVQSATNTCIAYDRFRIINDPKEGQIGIVSAVIMVIFTWGYAAFWTLMPLYEKWSRFAPEGYLTSCSFDYLTCTPENRMFVLCWFVCCFLVPLTVIAVFYLHVAEHVMDIQRALKSQATRMNVDNLRRSVREKLVTELQSCRTAMTIAGVFVVCWTPSLVVALIGAFGNQSIITPTVAMVPTLTCKLAACIDPYVYAISHLRFRRELQRRYPGLNLRNSILASTGTVRNGTVSSGTVSSETPLTTENAPIIIEMSETQNTDTEPVTVSE